MPVNNIVNKKPFVILLSLFMIGQLVCAQTYTSQNGKAIKSYVNGVKLYDESKYNEAEKELASAIGYDSNFIEAYLYLAGVYQKLNNNEACVDIYKKGLARNSTFYPQAFVDLANTEILLHRYNDACIHYDYFIKMRKGSERLRSQVLDKMVTCRFGAEAIKKPVPFSPKNMGDSINSQYNEYWPTITGDMSRFLITRLLPTGEKSLASPSFQEDFYIAERKSASNLWLKAKNLGLPLNTTDNEGAATLQTDGKSLIFTACNRPTGNGQCDLYQSDSKDGKWLDPINMGAPINTSYSEKQPSLSPDGKVLVFASNRPGGRGQLDLYFTVLLDDGRWTKPENMGDKLNTKGNDMAPYFHTDNQTLYFASDGHPGMGGLDMFLTRLDSSGQWGKPLNLGYPINTAYDEDGLIVEPAGRVAYFASNRADSRGGLDIYSFLLPKAARPVPTAYMKGRIYDAKTSLSLEARFEMFNNRSGELFMRSASDPKDGRFFMTIPSGESYALSVSKPGYLFFSENFYISDSNCFDKPYKLDIPLQPIEVGATIVLKNIFFDTDSFAVKDQSAAELRKIALFLNNNPTVHIEISGHTDNMGNDLYNMDLSVKRATSVTMKLIELGADSLRMLPRGYGETLPRATNETPEGRAENRRTELKIVAK